MIVTGREKSEISLLIREKARENGFELCGFAKARPLIEYIPVLERWCREGMNADMYYLARDIEKRFDPSAHLPGVKSVIVTGISYYSEIMQEQPEVPLLSRYAYGKDYHTVVAEKLDQLVELVKQRSPGSVARKFIDSGAISEKMWAREAGLGWQGRHSIIINRDIGSFFFIGLILTDIELEYDEPYRKDHCGDCRLCVDLCPTGAVGDDRTIDARKCIANLTIENRGPIPVDIIPKLGRRVYGCDRCQEVCPWNKNAKKSGVAEFVLDREIALMTLEDWKSLPEDKFRQLFRESAIQRVKFYQFAGNVKAALASDV